ncbi:MAG: tetratricopeptide repeat protein [Treponemataceae bacterium]
MNKKSYLILFPVSLILIVFSFCCKSVPRESADTASNGAEGSLVSLGSGEKLSIPGGRMADSAFSSIDYEIVRQVEIGTVKSLKSALASLHQADQNYTAEQAILMNIISMLMQVLYPQEKISWPIPDALSDELYMPILASVEKGIYDFNSGNKDFFSLMMPSLVLLTAPAVKNYYKEAEVSLNKALQKNSSSFVGYFLRGLLSYRMKNFENALAFFQKAYEIDESYGTLNKYYADILIKLGKNDLAAELTGKLLDSDPTNIEWLKISAYSCINRGDWEKAEPYIMRALQQQPDNPEFILLRAKILMSKGEYLNVSSLLDVYARTNSTSKDYLLLRATLQRDWNKNLSSAAATITEAINLYPHDVDVMLFLVSLMVNSSQKISNRNSGEILEEILEKDPNNVQAQKLKVILLSNSEQWNEAYQLSSVIVKADDCPEDLILMYIKICLKLNKAQEVRKILPTLNKISTDKSVYDLVVIQVLILEDNKSEALRQINAALTKDYGNNVKSSFYYEKARISSDGEQKLASLRASLTLNPRNFDSLFALYEYYFSRKDYRKSQYYLKQTVALNPQNQKLIELSSQIEKLLNAN